MIIFCKLVISNILFFIIFYKYLGIQMLTLLVPILINYLLEGDQLQHASKYQLSLHQQSFQWLNKIGPKYPQVSKLYYNIYYNIS